MSNINEIIEQIKRFRDERDWMQFHDPKNMAISISIEANELLEHFQWQTPEESKRYAQENKEEIAEEMADVAIYLLELADNIGIDLIEAIAEKMKKNSVKYPKEKAKGSHAKYTKL